MALMAALAWRGLDGMSRAQSQMRQQSDEVLALQGGLGQWAADLDSLALQPGHSSLDWDGRALRLLRRDPTEPARGLRVVAWSRRGTASDGDWLRWQSPALRTQGELQMAWQAAALWAQNPSAEERRQEVRIAALAGWQIFFYRGGAWANPLSSDGTATPGPGASASTPAIPALPDGVRLVLELPSGRAISGTLTRDWVQTTLGGRP